MTPTPTRARKGSGLLASDFAAKAVEIPRVVPLRARRWFRTFVLGAFSAAGLAAAVAIGFLDRWHDDRLAELARQRSCLQTFLVGPEFEAFTRGMDRHFVAMINFIAAQPAAARATLPAVAAHEEAHRLVPWTLQVMPLPVSAATEPGRAVRAGRDLSALLVSRGHGCDAAARHAARQTFLRLLVPSLNAFMQRAPGNGFPALMLERSLQEAALAAFAAHQRPRQSVAAMERLFGLYGTTGPAMWQAIERERAGRATPFALAAR